MPRWTLRCSDGSAYAGLGADSLGPKLIALRPLECTVQDDEAAVVTLATLADVVERPPPPPRLAHWRSFTGRNCFPGKGEKRTLTNQTFETTEKSAYTCMKRCQATPGCGAITERYRASNGRHSCWLRGIVNTSECLADVRYATHLVFYPQPPLLPRAPPPPPPPAPPPSPPPPPLCLLDEHHPLHTSARQRCPLHGCPAENTHDLSCPRGWHAAMTAPFHRINNCFLYVRLRQSHFTQRLTHPSAFRAFRAHR